MKRIIVNVIFAHVVILCWVWLWAPSKEKIKKPLSIRTLSLNPTSPPSEQTILSSSKKEVIPKKLSQNSSETFIAKSKPSQKKTNNSAPKSNVSKKVTQMPKKPKIPQYLLQQMQESMSKIEQNHPKKKLPTKLSVPNSVFQIESLENDQENVFTNALIECFQKQLQLPEVGEVKVALTLRQDGNLVEFKLLNVENQCNAQFLENALRNMHFPSFKGELAKQKEYTFVITFCNR